ncbi:MAG: 5,6-dimethylbenzimidazole synthase [Sneathiella sp.]|nr:5,6-dimethylbenzimidazole synthase [Sneathiella sp.]
MEKQKYNGPTDHSFTKSEREALYKTIFTRRDVRAQFSRKEIPVDVLSRILLAGHHAPSVGFMQPWSFTILQSEQKKTAVLELFKEAHAQATEMFEGERQDTYRNLKLEGITEAPINICVTCDKDRAGPVVLGRTHMMEMDEYSTVCAVQNMWLAARSEGVGMGWVSIMDPEKLKKLLGIPENIIPVAYLCLGYVSHFNDQPELQSKGWRERLPLADFVNFEEFQATSDSDYAKTLIQKIGESQKNLQGDDPLKTFLEN